MEAALSLLRYAVLGVVALAGAASGAAMLVQRRALNPFGRPARAIRDLTDPVLKPIERRVLRAGGNPQSAPWWLLGVAIVAGILCITLADWLAYELAVLGGTLASGGRGLVPLLLDWTLSLLMLALMVRVIGSWLGATRYTPWMRPFHLATEWLLAPIRRILPPVGPFDLSPLAAWFAILLLRSVLLG